MAEHVRVATTNMNSMEADRLFDKYTIDEIREIEKKTRHNIERKKEDLRQMVGERYRDVIEAADTITDMKTIAQNVSVSLTKMQDLCHSLEKSLPAKTMYQKPMPKFKPTEYDIGRKPKVNPLYGVSAEMKLLLEMPEKIWSAIDSGRLLRATQLFLLSRHVHTSLQLSPSGAALVRSCPLLSLQWASISQLRANILSAAKERLKTVVTEERGEEKEQECEEEQVTANCLVSILLLEDSTPAQVFNQFLQGRMAAIQAEFHAASQSVKATICSVVRILVTTIHQVYTVFCSEPLEGDTADGSNYNLLISTLDTVTSAGPEGVIIRDIQHTSPAMKYLPETVLDFRPATKHKVNAVPMADLRKRCNNWIDSCVKELQVSVGQSLDYMDSVKGLAGIRDAVWDLLVHSVTPRPLVWNAVCQHLLNKQLSVWDHFFRPLFLSRTKALLQSQLDNALSSTQQQVGRLLGELGSRSDLAAEHNVAGYVWKEGSGGDIVPSMAWLPASTTTLPDSGPLSMKAKAYTPAVQSLCRSFDNKLRSLLEDTSHYIKVTNQEASNKEDDQSEAPFDQFGDRVAVEDYTHTACRESVHKLLSHLEQQLYASKKQLTNSPDPRSNQLIIDRVLLMGRLVSALGDLCANLQTCAVGENKPQQAKSFKKSFAGRGSKVQENPQWTELKGKLTTFSQDAYRVWSDHTCGVLLGHFEKELLNTSGHGVLLSSTKWDDIEIEEETESGSKVRSTIRVPMQPSWYVQSVLYTLCQEINRVGGHALRKSTVQHLVETMSAGIISAYEKYLKESAASTEDENSLATSQNRALQLLFDVKFVCNVMPPNKPQEKEILRRVEKIADKLETMVDPFDLDVFSPYMKNHLTRQTQRCHVLYGALSCSDTASTLSAVNLGRSPASSHQEQHNLLPLSASASGQRFPLLPISVTRNPSLSSSQPAAPILAAPKPQTSPLHIVPGSPAHKAVNQPDSSFFGQMSTIWFSNVTSK